MMKNALCGLVAATMLLASSPSVMAQDRSLLLLGAGSTMPQGDFSEHANNGYHAQFGQRTRLGQSLFGIRTDVMYAKGDFSGIPAGGSAAWEIGSLGVGLQLEARSGPVRPYLLGQWAYYNLKGSATVLGQSFSETLKKGGLSAGGGLQFSLGRLRLFAEARYGFVSDGDSDTKFVPLTVGVTF